MLSGTHSQAFKAPAVICQNYRAPVSGILTTNFREKRPRTAGDLQGTVPRAVVCRAPRTKNPFYPPSITLRMSGLGETLGAERQTTPMLRSIRLVRPAEPEASASPNVLLALGSEQRLRVPEGRRNVAPPCKRMAAHPQRSALRPPIASSMWVNLSPNDLRRPVGG